MSSQKHKKPWLIFIAIFLAFFIGNFTGTESQLFGVTFYSVFDFLGTLFIRALTLVVIPLVASSIISGIARMGGDTAFKRLGAKTFSFYVITTLSAILLGLFTVNLLTPGDSEVLKQRIQHSSLSAVHIAASEEVGITHLLSSLIPSNIFDAIAKGNMLGVIFFSLLFGYALSKISKKGHATLQNVFQELFETMIRLTHLIMKFLPLGVFCLVAKVAATTGFESLCSLTRFFFTVLSGLALFMFVVLPLLLKYVGKVHPIRHFRAMGPALITAFSTSSSSASLPVTLDCVEKGAGVSNRICSLVIPLGMSLNMSGSALYECVAAMFVAQVYGLDLSFSSQVMFVLLSLLTSMGVAGIPSASLVGVVIILKAFHLPVEGIGLFLAVDRILDMCRTTVNVFSDSCCAVLVAKSEGETGILTKKTLPEIEK